MKFPCLLCCSISGALTFDTHADYRDDTGFTQLKVELGAEMLKGAGVGMTQVEPSLASPPFPANAYLPQGSGMGSFSGTYSGDVLFAGKQFTAKSGAGAVSFHADEVGGYMYGDDTGFNTIFHSMCPAVVEVDCWEANSYITGFLAPSGLAPIPEVRATQCHAWVTDAPAGSGAQYRDLVRRMDFSINRDDYVCSAGLNNGSATPIPDLWAAAYNVITVGITNGDHSRGTVTSDMDGIGRRKPEIVAPFTATSHATGYVASAAGLLRQKADLIGTANARRNKTIKAVLLAGATKEEFPAWAKTATDPVDSIYGAGELNIYNSYQIMNGGERAPGTTPQPMAAWDYHSLSAGGSAEYRLNVPAGQYVAEVSAFIVWHRTPTDTNASPSVFSLGNDALINFDLTLLRYPAAGGAAVTIDSSTSTIYNIEHVWKKNLPPGNYSLRVSRTAGISHDYAIAWRVTAPLHQPQPVLATSGNNLQFSFPDLFNGLTYRFQSSPDLGAWTDIESITGGTTVQTRTLSRPASSRFFYRLLPVLP